MVVSLGHTRSSHNWQEMPGNWDRLNTRAIYPATHELGIPDLPAATDVPARLVGYNSRHGCENAQPGDCIHFFLDDYRFEVVWNKPERGLSRPARVGMSLTPDFSLWREMPPVMQQWQVYRSRWCGLWMLDHGVKVIPTISWSDEASYTYAFAGIAPQSVVAIATVGVKPGSYDMFGRGLQVMMNMLEPKAVLVYGRRLPVVDDLQGFADVVYYPSRWEKT